MAPSKKISGKPATKPAAPKPRSAYAPLLWLVFFGGALFFWPQCLDRYLAPRFLFVSVALLFATGRLWKGGQLRGGGNFVLFDLLLLLWYGWNVASVARAFSWSEAVFYTQKVLLLLGAYGLARLALAAEEPATRRTLFHVVNALTLVVGVVIGIQTGISVSKYGLDNQHLYDYASGVFGHKNLAATFLFFLLIFNFLFKNSFRDRRLFWLSVGGVSVLILLLQSRSVYVAVALCALVYFPVRAVLEPAFRSVFLKKILPAGVAALVLAGALLAWKGSDTSLAERLNPATYLESASASERRFVWYKTDLLNRDHPWLGVGNGSWKIYFPSKSIQGAYRLQEQNIVMTRVHNDYLEIRAELGLIGLLLFLAVFAAALGALLLAIRQNGDALARHELLLTALGLMGYGVIQYFDFPRERVELQVWLGLLFALAVHGAQGVWKGRSPGPGVSGIGLLLLVAGLGFNVLIGWKRVDGEIHTLRALNVQADGDLPGLQREAAAAHNSFYEYNDVVIPIRWYEGIAFYQQNDLKNAVRAFEDAYRLNPWAFQVVNNLGTALVQVGRYPEAIALFEKALALNPRYDEGKFNIAYCHSVQGDFSKALEWLAKVDTIPGPTTEQERQKNKAVLKQKAEFEATIRGKMSAQ